MPEKDSSIDQTFRHPLCQAILFVLSVYLVLIVCYISHYEMNLTALYNIGVQDSSYQQQLIDPGVLVYKNFGYDGQYNYYLIKDFPLKGKFLNPFRAQRIFYPMLGWLFSWGGNSYLLPIVLVLINLLSIVGGMYLIYQMVTGNDTQKVMFSILYGLNIGFIVAVLYDLGTPLAVFLILLGFYYFQREHLVRSGVYLGLSLLTMENAWLVLVPLVAWLMYQKQFKKLIPLSGALIPWLTWQLIVRIKTGQYPIFSSAGFLDIPGRGIWEYLNGIRQLYGNQGEILRQLNVVPIIVLVIFGLVISGYYFYKKRSLLQGIILFHCCFALFLSYLHIWSHTITSSGRVLSGIVPFLFLGYSELEQKPGGYILLVFIAVILTILGLLRIAYLPLHDYFVVML